MKSFREKTEMHSDHQTIMIYSLEIYHSENSQQLLGTDLLNNLDILRMPDSNEWSTVLSFGSNTKVVVLEQQSSSSPDQQVL